MNQSSLLTRVAVAISIAVHVAAVALSLGYAGAGLYEASPEAVAVSLVTPEEASVEPNESTTEPKPEPDVRKMDLRLSPLDGTQQQEVQARPQTDPTAKPQPAPTSTPAARSAASAKQPALTQPPSPSPSPSSPQPAYTIPQPDISLRYQVDLGLKQMAATTPQIAPPNAGASDFDGPAVRQAEISNASIAAFRARLKQCAQLPAAISPDDKVVIVLRAMFTPDARLAAQPILIEASASGKGPALMQAAIAALQSCQPHNALPADKYSEWRVLEMRFTPQDFRRG